ncbi:Multidrug resistance-associated ABC transporter protein [Mycena sanguinolenta]|uniref:Multidrug resistance-associated ABC transporter protein n=1 Tax=Mycena sanguinolenta TaxID=230812 RepID=A0A8H6XY16_9AGAR|nr:Multidrug resistance-associated ABC transporter protein [Mycena sanguinolenta]
MDFTPLPQAIMTFKFVYVPPIESQVLVLLPACATAISAAILLLHYIFSLKLVNEFLARLGVLQPTEVVASPGIGRGAIFWFRAARLLGCLALLVLSIFPFDDGLVRGILRCSPYLYTSVLALLSVSPQNTRHRLIRHANCVLFLVFCIYIYRDLVPLLTFTGVPADLGEGRRLWAKIGLLFVTGVVIPLFTPQQYIPVDPLNPQAALNPEQTASIFSFAFYFFLDHIIFLAYRESQLQEEELYPLCDTDAAAHLKKRSFKAGHLQLSRHLFFGLMRVFYRDFTILAVLLVLRVLTNYSGPYAMNQLLLYIETRDDPDIYIIVRPWVWIGLIFLGPIIGAFAFQTYIFINFESRRLSHSSSLRTGKFYAWLGFRMALIFIFCSLRIRMKAETTEATDPTSGDARAPAIDVSPETESDTESTAETATPPENGNGPSRSEDDSTSATMQASSSSIKSKSTASKLHLKLTAEEPKNLEEKKKSGGSLVGKINNLVTVDLGNITDSRDFLVLLVYIPIQLAFGIYFLYVLLGWAVWVGVASILLLAPVPGYMAKLVQKVQKERLKRTDERVQSNYSAGKEKMKARIGDKRTDELVWIRKRRFIDLASTLINFLIPVITMSVTYATYQLTVNLKTLIMGQPLNASKVFSSMTIFDILRHVLDSIAQITGWLNNLMTGKVSLDRVNDFLKATELLDAFDENGIVVLSASDSSSDEKIGFRNATFSWSKESDGSLTRSQRQFQLKIHDEVLFQRGRINLVIGPTGSGKTSLLMALLGEMHFIPSGPDSWYNLPRNSGVAYAAQESWVLNETIRSNIVFDTPFDEERYKKVLYQCALEPDLKLFQAGDQTEVGEKGLTLSGGQKARLTLARAVYSNAGILLLDDVLAALEKVSVSSLQSSCSSPRSVHTAQWIVEKCFGGDLIQNRTVILVTHNVALTRPIADFVVSFGADGRIQSQGTISEITKRGPLAAQIHKDQQVLDKTQQQVDAEAPVAEPVHGKLILAEEIQLGHVSSSSLKMYFSAMGGKHPLFFFVFFFGGLFFQQIFVTLRTWQLGYWAKQYDDRPAEEVNVILNLSIFIALVFVSVTSVSVVFVYLVFGQLRASRVIHKNLIDSVLSAPLRWLDVTPTSRIIARVTNDVRAVDDSLADQFWPLTTLIVAMLVKFAAVVIYAPIFFFPGALVGALGAWIGQIYISGQLPVKRFMSNTRAPVLAHFGAAIAGLVSVRAFEAQSKFAAESLSRIDRYTRAARNYYNLNRWVSIRIDILGALFSASLATYLVYITHSRAGDAGFLINMAITFTQMLLWVVRSTNNFEVQGNSLERIQGYINIEHEKPATETGKAPAYWPASGDLLVEGLSARYSEDGPEVLRDISFHVKAGERIGIVGRTGSGKSSLTLSLLRCIPTEGSVRYDGLETSKLNLDALRSSITIIPQVPELLSGSLRANLDPFGQYDDAELNYALRAAGLFALQSEMDEGRITLDSAISSGGSNLSVGQRQIFALARAIVRKSKILILDEATSAIDYKTDSTIQNSLRRELRGDVSLLTVAHRLQTIMDADKIMVLDAGRLVEFGSPKELLKIKDGKLRALVEESGDRNALYAMAGAE